MTLWPVTVDAAHTIVQQPKIYYFARLPKLPSVARIGFFHSGLSPWIKMSICAHCNIAACNYLITDDQHMIYPCQRVIFTTTDLSGNLVVSCIKKQFPLFRGQLGHIVHANNPQLYIDFSNLSKYNLAQFDLLGPHVLPDMLWFYVHCTPAITI